jgi:hypothetical protein
MAIKYDSTVTERVQEALTVGATLHIKHGIGSTFFINDVELDTLKFVASSFGEEVHPPVVSFNKYAIFIKRDWGKIHLTSKPYELTVSIKDPENHAG